MRTRLKKARKDLGYTQAEFADKLGMTTTSYNYLENGKTPLQDKHIKAICAIFGISENWLRHGDDFEEFNNTLLSREILDVAKSLSLENQKCLLDFAKVMFNHQVDEYEPPAPHKPRQFAITAEDGEDLISEPAVYEDYLEGGEKS